MSWKRKLSELESSSVFSNCVWKGRSGPWIVALGLKALFSAIANATSERFQEMMDTARGPGRDRLLAALSDLKTGLLEVLKAKLDFWSHIPWKALGIFYHALVGGLDILELCRSICTECIDEYDAAVAAGHGDRLHRVAHRLLKSVHDAVHSSSVSHVGKVTRSGISLCFFAPCNGVHWLG